MNTEYDFSAATDVAREKVNETLSTVRHQAGQAVERGSRYVREQPAVSLASAFAVGVAVGAVVAVLLRPEPRKPTFADALDGSRDRLAELLGNVADQLRDPLQRTCSSVSESATSLAETLAHAAGKLPAPWWRR